MLLNAEGGYDLVAPHYDQWHWQEFWLRNERPIIEQILLANDAGRRLLDVGCGTGRFLSWCISAGFDAKGIDSSSDMLREAALRIDPERVCLGSAEQLPYDSNVFDVVTVLRTLSHIKDIEKVFRELSRVTTSTGALLITDIHGSHAYTNTTVRGDWGSVEIETFKRAPEEIIAIARLYGWEMKENRILTAKNLFWSPAPGRFQMIDQTGRRPISYITYFRKA